MRVILSSFELDSHRRTLVRELADVDARQLLDIGLVRGEDGSLRLAEDPSRRIGPERPRRAIRATLEGICGLLRWLRRLPFRSPDWSPHFFLRE
jgi:uncharacterized protein YjiS (DUF1127 family)